MVMGRVESSAFSVLCAMTTGSLIGIKCNEKTSHRESNFWAGSTVSGVDCSM